jgi:hypothetical protein
MPPRKRSVIVIANEQVSFTQAMAWAGTSVGERQRGMKATCPSCGGDGYLRVWPDHGWCFGCRIWFTSVRLLAAAWRMDREHAAIRALDKIGYVPPSLASLWADARRPPEPVREELAQALLLWCEANCPDWTARQYDPAVARRHAACLGLLPKVATAEDCALWLVRCKEAMGDVLSQA